ncbi:hypothetical protein GCM10020219_071410 [Nonomuraea dietziae]
MKRSLILVEAGRRTSGTTRATAANPTAARPTTSHSAERHPATSPIQVPSGTPIAEATVSPPITSASARAPRRSGPTRAVATAEATGVTIAAPAAAITLVPSMRPKVGESAVSAFPAASTPRPMSSSRRLDSFAVNAASTGESRA